MLAKCASLNIQERHSCLERAIPCTHHCRQLHYHPDKSQRLPAGVCASIREGTTLSTSQSSLIPLTLEEMQADTDQQQLLQELSKRGQQSLTREERLKRKRSLELIGAPTFNSLCQERGVKRLSRDPAKILQLNIGLYCNQACSHCHVESSPRRTEMMDSATAKRCMDLLRTADSSVSTVDITGGAPELNSQFRYLVSEARSMGFEVIDRCNLTVLCEPGQEDLVDFLAAHQVRVVASLPCYSTKNVDEQRGRGVFERSIDGLQKLNRAGYGQPGTGLILDLVYNPNGAFLAPSQAALEKAYKQELQEAFGVAFNNLFCLNNMPIKRFADYLSRRGEMETYMQLLVSSFNAEAANGVMCRDTINVGWDGRIYDCDFNQQLDLSLRLPTPSGRSQPTVFSIESLSQLSGGDIACDNHCFGCTAGSGSSCQGATA